MTIITYTKGAYREKVFGVDWVLLTAPDPHRDTLIIDRLIGVAKNHVKTQFDEMGEILREAYNNKTVRSQCQILVDKNKIEVIIRGVFPRFFIRRGSPNELLSDVARMVIEHGSASTSHIQRRFNLNYSQASNVMNEMEALGIVGPHNGAKPRDIRVTLDQLKDILEL